MVELAVSWAGLYWSNFNKGVQSLDNEQNTVWNGLYANNGGYNRPLKQFFDHIWGSATMCRGLNPLTLDKYSPEDSTNLELTAASITCMQFPFVPRYNINTTSIEH